MSTRAGLLSAARALGGEVVSGAISCPGSGHSPHDRSLRVYQDWQAPSGWRVHSLAGDDWKDCQEHVRDRLGLPKWEPKARDGNAPRPAQTANSEWRSDDDTRPQTALRMIFREARPLVNTIGATYLERRIGARLDWPADVRFHPKCAGRFGPERKLEFHPAIVALYRGVVTNEPRAIYRTFLKPDGSDRLRNQWGAGDQGKLALGPSAGCAIKLSPDECVSDGLGLGEGLETCLSVMQLGWAPIWCMTGTSIMAKFPVLAGIEALTLFADNDRNSAGRRAAGECARRWAEARREVQIITPRTCGADWNDVLRAA